MSERWMRLYEGVVHDPKMQRLPAEVFKGLINVWCIASAHGGTLPPLEDVAFTLRLTEAKAQALLDALIAAGLLDEDDAGLHPHNWNGRQFKSDVSTGRVKRHRERSRNAWRNGGETFHETQTDRFRNALDTETDTDTESETEKDPSHRDGTSEVDGVSDRRGPLNVVAGGRP